MKKTLTGRWSVSYLHLASSDRGLITLDVKELTRLEALEVVNRWNNHAHGRWCYVLIGRGLAE